MGFSAAPILLLVTMTLTIISNATAGFSVSKFGDVSISNTNGILQCDQIVCPEGTVRCHVIKLNSEENLSKLKRQNICYGANDEILKEKIWIEECDSNKLVNVHIDMYSDGRSSVTNTHQDSESFTESIMDGIAGTVSSIVRGVSSFIQSLDMFPFF